MKSKKRESMLEEAMRISGNNRQRDYGHPLINHQRICDMWNVVLGNKLKSPIQPREAAMMMICVKISREVNTPKRDNIVDIAGYVNCIDLIDAAVPQRRKGGK